MGLINVTELKPDMVLASPLTDRNGRFLLGKGTTLTSKHLRILKIWGIIEADIEGISREEVQAESPPGITKAGPRGPGFGYPRRGFSLPAFSVFRR